MANPKKTYILAPTRESRPDTVIRLGNIISDPKWPEESTIQEMVAGKALPSSFGPFTKTDFEYSDTRRKGYDISHGVFAEFLQVVVGIGGDVEGHTSREKSESLYCSSLETHTINPNSDYIASALKMRTMKDYLRKNKPRLVGTTVFMITGVKIARGASVCTKKLRKKCVHAQVGVNLAALTGAPVSVGPKVGHEQTKARETRWNSDDDFVYAYRLRKIVVKRSGDVQTEAYTKGAMLSLKDEDEVDSDQETDTDSATYTIEDLGDPAEGDIDESEAKNVNDDEGESCICLALPSDD